jgi:acetyl esterase/lipase
MLANITIAQSRYIYPSTIEAYISFCEEVKQKPNRVGLNDTSALWIGEKAEDADVVVLYLHGKSSRSSKEATLTVVGGGYTQPCQTGYLHYLYRLTKDMEAKENTKKSVSILLLAYTLVPEAHYPAQLNEAATVLSYLLSEKKQDPTSIMVGGDSAGGNLVVSLLSHILHPRPETPLVVLTAPLRGIFLCSPWVSFSTEHASYSRNAGKDTLVDSMLRRWGSMYLGMSEDGKTNSKAAKTDSYNEPLQNEYVWWQGMHKVMREVFIWMGTDEIFIDGQREFAKLFRKGWEVGGGNPAAIKVYEAPDQAHIGPIMDVMMQNKEKSQPQLDIEKWFEERLD